MRREVALATLVALAAPTPARARSAGDPVVVVAQVGGGLAGGALGAVPGVALAYAQRDNDILFVFGVMFALVGFEAGSGAGVAVTGDALGGRGSIGAALGGAALGGLGGLTLLFAKAHGGDRGWWLLAFPAAVLAGSIAGYHISWAVRGDAVTMPLVVGTF